MTPIEPNEEQRELIRASEAVLEWQDMNQDARMLEDLARLRRAVLAAREAKPAIIGGVDTTDTDFNAKFHRAKPASLIPMPLGIDLMSAHPPVCETAGDWVGVASKELAVALSEAWKKYEHLFREVPHGTEQQMGALLELGVIKALRTAAEREMQQLRQHLADAAKEINCAGPVAHRIRVMKAEWAAHLEQRVAQARADAVEECEKIFAKFDDEDKFDIGCYPAAIKGYNDERDYKQRDGYKNGWNAAIKEFLDVVHEFRKAIRALAPESAIQPLTAGEELRAVLASIEQVRLLTMFSWPQTHSNPPDVENWRVTVACLVKNGESLRTAVEREKKEKRNEFE